MRVPGFLKRIFARIAALFMGPLLPITRRIPAFILKPFARLIDPAEFAADVSQMPDDKLQAMLEGSMRTVLLDEVVNRMQTEFRPEAAAGMNAVFRFDLAGAKGADPDVYQVTIRDGSCVTGKGAPADRDVQIKIAALDFVKMAAGMTNGVVLYMSGRLKSEGDFALLTRLSQVFEIPGSGREKVAA